MSVSINPAALGKFTLSEAEYQNTTVYFRRPLEFEVTEVAEDCVTVVCKDLHLTTYCSPDRYILDVFEDIVITTDDYMLEEPENLSPKAQELQKAFIKHVLQVEREYI